MSLLTRYTISIKACDVALPTVVQATLVRIWTKAEQLLCETGLVLGSKTAYIVASKCLKKPHFVQLYSSGRLFAVSSVLCGEATNCVLIQLQLQRKLIACLIFLTGSEV